MLELVAKATFVFFNSNFFLKFALCNICILFNFSFISITENIFFRFALLFLSFPKK